MKRISFFLVILCALLLSVGLNSAQAQNGIVDIRGIVGLYQFDTVSAVSDLSFLIGMNNNTGSRVDFSNGWMVWSYDGATFDSMNVDSIGPNPGGVNWLSPRFDLIWGGPVIQHPAVHVPSGPDTAGFIGASSKPLTNTAFRLPIGFNDTVIAVNVFFNHSGVNDSIRSGKHICIDTAFFPPAGTWVWPSGGNSFFPDWIKYAGTQGDPTQPLLTTAACFAIYKIPNLPPQVKNTGSACPGGPYVDPTLSGSHCGAFTYDFDACDAEGDPITFEQMSGPGTTNATTGVWAASGLATGSYSVVVRAKDAQAGAAVTLTVNVTNAVPVIATGCGALVGGFKNAPATTPLTGTDADACDPKNWSIVSIAGPAGVQTATVVGGLVTFTSDTPGLYTVTVGLSDGIVASPTTCTVQFDISSFQPYGLVIQKVHDVIQGTFQTVDVNALAIDTRYGMGGFDLLIAYDNSALSLQGVTTGTVYSQCKWEYFTYRFGANGNCSGGCPSGLVRIVGLAETNNGAAHPVVDCPNAAINLFHLQFLVSNNRTFACSYAAVRWFWIDCGDNTISSTDGAVLSIESSVYDWAGTPGNPYVRIDTIGTSPFAGFPGYYGVQAGLCHDSLPGKPVPIRNINFYNGGIDIVCAESIDARGDVNLNTVSYEIADAVMFTNYFIKGLSAFTVNVDGSIAATDVNADGIALSVADLVYLIRVIVGDALPYPKNAVHDAKALTTVVSNDNGTLAVADQMGGAFIVVAGNVKPTLLASNMDMSYGFDGQNTRIVVVPSIEHFSGFTGAFINVNNAEVVSIDMATLQGEAVVAKVTPANFALKQNYPNPFNPTTTISFALPTAAQYTLTIYNVTGQSVAEFTGSAQAGNVDIVWNATNNASGVYFYKLSAGSFTATKKMVLLK
ncbi:MAG: T9SS type A sorting domain-containing protein [Candidatus Zixiibacteriota bacterium]